MHTSEQLKDELFDITIDEKSANVDDLFPEWETHDRFGVLVTQPLGGLGASLLIQAATTAFYNHRRRNVDRFRSLVEPAAERMAVAASSEGLPGTGLDPVARAERGGIAFPVYAETYALHMGRRQGSHSGFDIWPPYREPLVSGDFEDLASAVASLGITRLALPEVTPRHEALAWEIRGALRERVRDIIVYGLEGEVRDPDITIRGTEPVTEENPRRIFSAPAAIAALQSAVQIRSGAPEFQRSFHWAKPHADEIPIALLEELQARRASKLVNGTITESYRRATLDDALGLIAGVSN